MKRHLIAATLAVAAPSLAFAANYEIDSSHSSANFTVRHLMVSNVKGAFPGVKGKVDWDDKDVAKSKVEATIDVASIDTNEPKRDAHLKSPDFFDVEKYPTITFKSKHVVSAGAGYKLVGDLTMHGVTKEVALDVEKPSVEVKDPWGNVKRGFTATAKLNRKDFGLGWNKVLESGGVAVGEEVKIELEIEANKAQPKEAASAKK